jgi:sugar phosphate isomerase/epimerase
MIIAAKCAPEERILKDIEKAGLSAVEIYTCSSYLCKIEDIKKICKRFSFRYAVHAPNDGYEPELLAELVDDINAEIVVFHDIYWEDEWEHIAKIFKADKAKICIENTHSVHEPLKLMRRYGFKRCLDLEHLQMQCAGVYEDEFLPVMRQASHIHMTGYFYGSDLWHTHTHQSPEHSVYMLNLLKKADYSGFVVSEARTLFQTYDEFRRLNDFFVNAMQNFDRPHRC